MSLGVPLIKTYRFVKLFKSLCVLAVSAVNTSKLKQRRASVRIVPSRAVKNIVSLTILTEILKSHTLKIKCLSIGRMLVAIA